MVIATAHVPGASTFKPAVAAFGPTVAVFEPTATAFGPTVIALKPALVESTAIEVRSVVPFERRTIVFIVDTVAEVSIPRGVVVVSIPWEIVLIYDSGRCGRISVLVVFLINRVGCRSGILLIYYSRRRRGAYKYSHSWYTNMGANIYL
jgi:hypothetical protein